MNNLIEAYANARKEIHHWLDEQGVPWNDNIVGRIGEFHAIEYARKAISNDVIPATSSNQIGFDFCIGEYRYSVKTITKENSNGATSPIKLDSSWDFLIAIKLEGNLDVESLSVIDYPTLKSFLDNNSIKQKKTPGIKKSFRWWTILNKAPYKKI